MLSRRVWISSIIGSNIGDKQGLHWIYPGREWTASRHVLDPPTQRELRIFDRHRNGFPITHDEMPEALAIFDRKRFEKIGDLFLAGYGFAVKGALAEVLARHDLGEGELIPLPIYQEDRHTPEPGEFFLLNFGARKASFLPAESRNCKFMVTNKDTGIAISTVRAYAEDDDVALSPVAIEGADLWFEQQVFQEIFVSDRLAVALVAARLDVDLRLKRCRVVEA